ncbi:MAG TPA: DALR domain-containing protein, partial [Flavitalea sp.]|nr:DALR domain-containing protein [Flavitalea sp.]
HHESEIAQSNICNHHIPARYWMHNNMITVNGKKMGKSYNNQIRLTEMFSGNHPLLEKAYSPMTIRFFILQTHYRSTLDFGNEALQAAEKGMKRLWEAYEILKKMTVEAGLPSSDKELDNKLNSLLDEMDEFMNDDLNTAKVLANLFEIVPVINGLKDRHIPMGSIGSELLSKLQTYFKAFIEDILGLQPESHSTDHKLSGVLDLLIDLRKDARGKKDYATSDKIRTQLASMGIQLKDEKDGSVSYSID